MSSRVLRKRKRGTSPPEGSNNGVHKQARLEEQQSAEQVMDLDEKQTQGDTDDADMFAKWTTLADSSSRQNSSPDRQQEEPRAASESLSMPIEDLELLKDLTYGADPSPSSLQPDSDMAGEALVLMDETPTVELPTAEVLAAIAQSDSVIINNNNNNNVNEEDDLQMTGYGPAPSYAVDLTAVPSSPPPPPFPPLSPLAPGRFRYFRPLRPGPTKREPTFQIDEQNPHDWTFDYDFSDDEDVPKPLFDPGRCRCPPLPSLRLAANMSRHGRRSGLF